MSSIDFHKISSIVDDIEFYREIVKLGRDCFTKSRPYSTWLDVEEEARKAKFSFNRGRISWQEFDALWHEGFDS